MNRDQFVIAVAITLFAAFVLGWFAAWLVHRLTRPTRAEIGELDQMARQLLEARQARDTAQGRLATSEAALARLQGDHAVAMDSLRAARTEIEELRDYIDRKLTQP